jgi:hypothetical protein
MMPFILSERKRRGSNDFNSLNGTKKLWSLSLKPNLNYIPRKPGEHGKLIFFVSEVKKLQVVLS